MAANEEETMDNAPAIAESEPVDELQPGTKLLGDQYTIVRFLNSGGFGMTYLAKDSLNRLVVIKECFIGTACRRSENLVRARSRAHTAAFSSAVELFTQEARSQAKLVHPNIVGVHQVFNDNYTAYMAIDYIDGSDLLDKVKDDKDLDPADVMFWLRKTLDAVGFIHNAGMLHRDISPDNILIGEDNEPIMIDFGAAREQENGEERVLSTMRVIKDGYSPQEFYVSGSKQNESSDLYSLAASFYHLVSGKAPPDSQARLMSVVTDKKDVCIPLVGRFDAYPKPFLAAIDKAMNVLPKDRCQSAQEWLNLMDGASSGKKVKGEKVTQRDETVGASRGKAALMIAATVVAVAAVGALALTSGPRGDALVFAEADVPAIGNTSEPSEGVRVDVFETPVAIPDQAVAVESAAALPTPQAVEPVTLNADIEPKPAPIAVTAETQVPAIALEPSNGSKASLILSSDWSVETPFETSEVSVKEGTFALITMVRTDIDQEKLSWVHSGRIIYSVNGIIVYDNQSINAAVSQSVDLAESEHATLNIRTRANADSPLEEQVLSLPVVRIIELSNGFRFTATYKEDAWETKATRIPSNLDTELEIGDVILSEAQSEIVLHNYDDIEQAFAKLAENGARSAYFTVSRNGKLESARLVLSKT